MVKSSGVFFKKDLDYILEVNCDHHVIKELNSVARIDYVETTVKIMMQMVEPGYQPSACALGFVGIAEPKKIVQRCKLILYPPKKIDKRIAALLGVILFALIAVSYAFIIQPATPASKTKLHKHLSRKLIYVSKHG